MRRLHWSVVTDGTSQPWSSRRCADRGQTIGDADGGPGLEDIVQLSHTLGAATLSRVVMATASADASFILAALEPALAKTVRAELAASRPLPPALAAAVRNAAHAQAAAAHPARRVVP